VADLIIKIAGDISDFKSSLDQVGQSASDSGDSLSKIALGAGAAFTALAAAISYCVDQYAETELASKEVNLALQNQGIYSDELVKSYKAMADAQERVTGIDADEITKGQAQLQNLIGQTKITPQLTQAMLDLSVKTGSVSSAAQMLGMWLDGNNRGMKLYGITVDSTASSHDRLAQITEQVEQKFGGLAQSMDTGLGSMKGLRTSFNDIAKDIGEQFAPIVSKATGLLTEFFQHIHDGNKLAADPMHQLNLEIAAVQQGLINISKGGTYINVNTGQVITDMKQLKNQLDILEATKDDMAKAGRGSRQDSGKKEGADEAAGRKAASDKMKETENKDHLEAMKEQLEGHEKEVTDLLTQQADVEGKLKTAYQNDESSAQKTFLKEKLENIKESLAQQKTIEEGQRVSLQDDILAKDKAFNDLDLEETKTFAQKNFAVLKSSIDTISTAKQKAALDDAKLHIKANNQYLLDQAKFGTTYAALNKATHTQEIQDAESLANQMSQLQSSKSAVLVAIGKAAAIADIGIKTAQGAVAAEALSISAFGPVAGPIIGTTMAAALIAFGAEQVGTILGFDKGGLVTGGMSGVDSVPILAQQGELIAPKQNFDEVVNAVANQRAGGFGSGSSGGPMGIVISMDGQEAQRVLTARQTQAKALGIYTGT
jgi:hypothetical protein